MEILETKSDIYNNIEIKFKELPKEDISSMTKKIEAHLFELANFAEAKIALLYIERMLEVPTSGIIKKCYELDKVVVLPLFTKHTVKFLKVDDPKRDLKIGARNVLEPSIENCKLVPIDKIDIAIIPGVAFDEKNGRLGTGEGLYDKLIPKLSPTTRKVALGFEFQVVAQLPMDSGDRYVDIIVTEERILYKI